MHWTEGWGLFSPRWWRQMITRCCTSECSQCSQSMYTTVQRVGGPDSMIILFGVPIHPLFGPHTPCSGSTAWRMPTHQFLTSANIAIQVHCGPQKNSTDDNALLSLLLGNRCRGYCGRCGHGLVVVSSMSAGKGENYLGMLACYSLPVQQMLVCFFVI